MAEQNDLRDMIRKSFMSDSPSVTEGRRLVKEKPAKAGQPPT